MEKADYNECVEKEGSGSNDAKAACSSKHLTSMHHARHHNRVRYTKAALFWTAFGIVIACIWIFVSIAGMYFGHEVRNPFGLSPFNYLSSRFLKIPLYV